MRAVVTISMVLFTLVSGASRPSLVAAGEPGQKAPCCDVKGAAPIFRHRLCDRAPLPPDAPILDSVAIRRVAVPQATRYRIEQTAGDLDSVAAASCGTDKLSAAIKTLESDDRLQEFSARLDTMDQQLNRLLELIRAQQKIVDELAERAAGTPQ